MIISQQGKAALYRLVLLLLARHFEQDDDSDE